MTPHPALCHRTLLLAAALVAGASCCRSATFDAAAYGASGRDVRADTAAIQHAIDDASHAGGGTVVIPDGAAFTVGTVVLRSHVELHLGRGSVLRASPRHEDFTRFALQPVEFPGSPSPRMGVVVYAEDAEDIAVTGPGTIDGNEMAYVTKKDAAIYTCTDLRPFSMVLRGCSHVLLRDFTLRNSAFWTLRLIGCDDADIDSLRIDGDLLMPNNDGIDIDWSSNVRIHDCNISTGDDCISLKAVPLSGGITRPCEHVVIHGCTLRSRSSGIVLGCDVAGPIRDVVVSDCVITDSHRGVSVRLSLGGSIENALFTNLIIQTRIFDERWWGRGEPIQIEAVPWTADSKLGVVRNIRFSNIEAVGENGVLVYAAQPGHIENVVFDRVRVRVDPPKAFAAGRQDLRPTAGEGLPSMPTDGFLLRNAAGVTFRDCSVSWGPGAPACFEHALDASGCARLDASGLSGPAAHPELSPQNIQNTP
jgi:polygalacturonase